MAYLQISLPLPHIAINVEFDDTHLTRVDYVDLTLNQPLRIASPLTSAEQLMAKKIREEISAYGNNPNHRFTLPIRPEGTDFQRRVWKAMESIPVGETRTYGEVANQLNSAPRAVGGACGANPLPLFIPCHRIVGKQHLGGFSHQRDGVMLVLKKALLMHEGALPH